MATAVYMPEASSWSDEAQREYVARNGGALTWMTGDRGYGFYWVPRAASIVSTTSSAAGTVTTRSLSPGLEDAWNRFPNATHIAEHYVPPDSQKALAGVIAEYTVYSGDRSEFWRKWSNASWQSFDPSEESRSPVSYIMPSVAAARPRPSPVLGVQPFTPPIASDPEVCRGN